MEIKNNSINQYILTNNENEEFAKKKINNKEIKDEVNLNETDFTKSKLVGFKGLNKKVTSDIEGELPKLKIDNKKRYLNIFWNQHQPYYKDEVEDCFTAPWVRLHATKDYYNMAAILTNYPEVHSTINLSASLLRQLDEYTTKLYDFADVKSPNYKNISAYPAGHVDKSMDLLVKPVKFWSDEEKQFAKDVFFSAEYDSQIGIFPGYKALWDKWHTSEKFTEQDFINLKCMFNLVWFDHTFQAGDVKLIGSNIDGTKIEPEESVTMIDDLMIKGIKNKPIVPNYTEEDALNIALEQYKVLKYVIPVHRYLQNCKCSDGSPQVEVVTTPFYHPILPMINDSSILSKSDPWMEAPYSVYKAPDDANAQVIKGVKLYERLFGKRPIGMWPGEGAVSEDIIGAFQKNGIKWISTGNEVAQKSGHIADTGLMYRIDVDNVFLDRDNPDGTMDNSDALSIVFRSIHDRIGFDYGAYKGKLDGVDAANDFLSQVRAFNNSSGVPQEEDIFVSNLADGENCWVNYWHNGNDFLHSLYGILNDPNKAYIKTATPSSFLKGHPVEKQWEVEPLAAGSWVGGSFSTWAGEPSENEGWERLKICRDSLIKSGIPKVDPYSDCPDPREDRDGYFIWKAWESLYAAEGSDWFWWYGDDQGDNGRADAKFSEQHRAHMINSYVFGNKAGYRVGYPFRIKAPLDASKITMPVPPLTDKPMVSKKEIMKNKESEVYVSINAYQDINDSDSVKRVSADMSELGIKEPVELQKNFEGSYFAKVLIPAKESTGKKLIRFEAESTNDTKSMDFATIKVV